jgi:hypothetical protein
MEKQMFNEPEMYILEKWADAKLLEESMESMRNKYREVFDKVLERVQEQHKELDCSAMHFAAGDDGINVAVGKSTWPCRYPKWPSGLWLSRVRLDDVASEPEYPPGACIWIRPPVQSGLDLKKAANKLREAARQVLPKGALKDFEVDEGKSDASIWYPLLPESRQELLAMVKKEDGSAEFIDCMVTHFELLAKFIPVIDEIFQTGKRSRK